MALVMTQVKAGWHGDPEKCPAAVAVERESFALE
jgi:hypothetical protein